MDASHIVRAARRHAGLSQRELAARCGVSLRAIAAIESGAQSPKAATIDEVLAAVGLDVSLVARLGDERDLALERHLRLSLTQRLRIALGERETLPTRARSDVWRDLGRLARRGQVVVEPPLATALWLPVGRVDRATVSVYHARTAICRGHIDVRVREGDAPACAIFFMMEVGERLWVLPPGELARPTQQETQLRQADLLLHAQAPHDKADRRRPAHRDPDEAGEDWRMLRTKSIRDRPDMRDGRGWRLGAPASLAQRLARAG